MKKGIITGLAHIGVFVKDMDKSIDFYKRLGFTLDKEEQLGIRLAFLSAGTCLIELVEKTDIPTREAGVVDHVAVVVDDIEAAIDNAIANGINIDASLISEVPILGGVKNVFFEGPDGERLEFFEYCSNTNLK
ncbi:MAG: VOC family protein [Defluviitaleaceae bacterium]|nr:VOC family protein [Defluviitaleaceae bacterium]